MATASKHDAPIAKAMHWFVIKRHRSRRSRLEFAFLLVLFAHLVFAATGQAAASLDPSFSEDGIAIQVSENPSQAFSLAEDPIGRLVAVGIQGSSACPGYYAARFLETGQPDSGFGGQGFVLGPRICDFTSAVTTLPGGGVVIGGQHGYDPSHVLASCAMAQRLRPDGDPAPEWQFGTRTGRRKICNGNPGRGAAGYITADIAVDGRGRVLLGGAALHGQSRSGGFVLRFTRKGALDRSLRGEGRTRSRIRGVVEILPTPNHFGEINEVKALGNGKILVGGFLRGRFMAAQMRNDGSLDRSFGRGGIFTLDVDGRKTCACSAAIAMARDYHKRILLAGVRGTETRGYHLVLVRLRPNGSLDRKFGHRGIARPIRDAFYVRGVAVQQNGSIVVAGRHRGKFTLLRLHRDGRLDRSFFGNGLFSTTVFGENGSANDVIIDHRGRIIAAGGSDFGSFQLVRILPD